MSALSVANSWYSLPSLVGVSSIWTQYAGNFFKRTGWGRTVTCLPLANNFGGLHKTKEMQLRGLRNARNNVVWEVLCWHGEVLWQGK